MYLITIRSSFKFNSINNIVNDLLTEVYVKEIASNMLNDNDYKVAELIASNLFQANQAMQSYRFTNNPSDIKEAQEHNRIALELFNQHVAKGANSISLSAIIRDQLKAYETGIS